MSATSRGAEREKDDFYETPAWCVDLILPVQREATIFYLDLGCGSGAIMDAVRAEFPYIELAGVELNDERAEYCRSRGHEVETGDVLSQVCDAKKGTVIMNPPYKLALEFVTKALEIVGPSGTVCALLRLNWLASRKRRPFHQAHPSDVFVLPRRPSFTPDGKTDATEYAWFVWGPDRGNRWFIL